MKRRFEPVASQLLDKIEREKIYKQHMRKVSRVKGAVDSTQPDLSPRHRLIAQRAVQRHADFLRRTQSRVRTYAEEAQIPYSAPYSQSGTSRVTTRASNFDPYAASLFQSPMPCGEPDELNFLASYHNNQSKSRAVEARAARSRVSVRSVKPTSVAEVQNESDSDDQILDVDLSSDSLSSDVSSDSFGVS